MAVNQYLRGRVVRVTGTVVNENGTPVNPTTMTFKVKNPAGTTTTYVYGTDSQVVRPSTGSFYVDVTASTEGRYQYRWESTTPNGADEGEFRCDGGNFD